MFALYRFLPQDTVSDDINSLSPPPGVFNQYTIFAVTK
jgi:hypothetical protein